MFANDLRVNTNIWWFSPQNRIRCLFHWTRPSYLSFRSNTNDRHVLVCHRSSSTIPFCFDFNFACKKSTFFSRIECDLFVFSVSCKSKINKLQRSDFWLDSRLFWQIDTASPWSWRCLMVRWMTFARVIVLNLKSMRARNCLAVGDGFAFCFYDLPNQMRGMNDSFSNFFFDKIWDREREREKSKIKLRSMIL